MTPLLTTSTIANIFQVAIYLGEIVGAIYLFREHFSQKVRENATKLALNHELTIQSLNERVETQTATIESLRRDVAELKSFLVRVSSTCLIDGCLRHKDELKIDQLKGKT